ncbi:hypothetical protein Bca52824_046345 [Brassica carinata]|uniref:Uncharacterized protein n=1 Tax=Brassica carinata TaxID=52824 RepID=A0A8X7UR19_BRACI|nr:hypothetical protein Bca52824_046345 [Brassica carinata]
MISLSLANKPRRPLLRGQAVCIALGREGRGSAAGVTVSVGRALFRCPVVDVAVVSRPVDVLVSSVGVVVHIREFPFHWLLVKRDCCSTNKALWRASETELGSNWCSMFCS